MYSIFNTYKSVIIRSGYIIGISVVVIGIMVLIISVAKDKKPTSSNINGNNNTLSAEEKSAIKNMFDERTNEVASQQQREQVHTKLREKQEERLSDNTPSQQQKDTIINTFTQ